MLRTSITQEQCEVPQRNQMISEFLPEHVEPSYIIKTMIKIIKTKSKESMDKETRTQFSKITDAILRMTKEIRE
ncbi:MAG: hypothetical protein ACREAD_05705 [Nitrosopumilaceae archaeon]